MSDQRLRRSADIRAVFGARAAAHGRSMVVHVRPRGDGAPARWTVVAGRKVGGAVQRNRAKRRARAALAGAELPAGVDIVLVARACAVSAPFAELCAEVRTLLAAASTPVKGQTR